MGLEELIAEVRGLLATEVKGLVDSRINEFRKTGSSGPKEIFKELCFCILAAGFSAERSMIIQKEIDDGFLSLPEEELSLKLKMLGHRYYSARARYIVKAREKLDLILEALSTLKDDRRAREWLANNIAGLGYKEASHFLRNIGRLDVAIIDFHILDLLERYRVIGKPKTMTRKRYLEIERLLETISAQLGLRLGELDLYLWYLETGKILK